VPYHSLTGTERETFNARRALLEHLGHLLRSAAVAREHRRALADEQAGKLSEHWFIIGLDWPCPSAVYQSAP